MSLEMYKDLFKGESITLSDMLAIREARQQRQQELLDNFPSCTLLVATLNIPGPIKRSAMLDEVFKLAMDNIEQKLVGYRIRSMKMLMQATGNEAYYVIDSDAETVKRLMIYVEETYPQGRLLDLDVLHLDEAGMIHKMSRSEFVIRPRRCFVCEQDAKVCARSQRHTQEEIQQAIINLVAGN